MKQRRKLPQKDDDARLVILDAYTFAMGKTSVAAAHLGLHRTSLLRLVRELGLEGIIARRWPHPGRVGYRALARGSAVGA